MCSYSSSHADRPRSRPTSGVNPYIFCGGDRGAEGGGCGEVMWICGAFLVQFFCSSAKTLRGRKDTLAQVYFYWGGGNQPPRPRPGLTPLRPTVYVRQNKNYSAALTRFGLFDSKSMIWAVVGQQRAELNGHRGLRGKLNDHWHAWPSPLLVGGRNEGPQGRSQTTRRRTMARYRTNRGNSSLFSVPFPDISLP